MDCQCDKIARKIYEESVAFKGIAEKAKEFGDDALASETAALSKALCYVALYVSSKDVRELNRLMAPYRIIADNLPKMAEEQARRTRVSRELCGNGD